MIRRHRGTATRDCILGAVVVLGILVLLGDPPEVADADQPDPGAGQDGARAETVFSAAMVGDLMFGRHVEEVTRRQGPEAPLEPAAPYLDADYVSGNLEQVVSERDDLPEADKLIHLRTGPAPLEALDEAGFTTLTLANNHTMDHGLPGLADTIAALDEIGLDHVGAGEDLDDASDILYQEFGDLTVATLSFTDVFVEGFVARAFQGGVRSADPDAVVPAIERARSEADLVIAQFHWGEEYDFGPNADQRDLAEVAAQAGADVVVGHHPHVLMPVETIDDTLVLYSLGNFVFDQGWTRTRETAVARYELGRDGVARVVLEPMYIREATPRPLSGIDRPYRRARIHDQLAGDLDWERAGDALVAEIDHGHVLEQATDEGEGTGP
ncbi:CapA family protein [Egibacter rhizosphaerae]|uniref:CapA family protein n=1 Tax=Egibacter rhizosphaerae TaxID=1670831 RepID=A0A411YAI8_9ACTN|nr:CapA family protein [Egibacter rhizosphaerae]QBI18233.1 CapA family protein [Egibacter rhizosphaerae]